MALDVQAFLDEFGTHAASLESIPCPPLFRSLHENWEYPGLYFYEINLGDDRPERAAGSASRRHSSPRPVPNVGELESRVYPEPAGYGLV